MAQEQAASSRNMGKELMDWEVVEEHLQSRGAFWYVAAAAVAILLLIYAVATRNFLFAFIIIMVGVITVTHGVRPAVRQTFYIFERGIRVGERFYPWKDIKRFWMVYEPPEVKTLYFDFGGLRPRLMIPLHDADPNAVRQALSAVLPEDTERTEEPMTDWLARVLKI